MEDQQLNPLAITHLLQHTLRSLCSQENSHSWLYAVFWRILPRNFPPPKWDLQGGAYDRARGNRRNWILVWEDGFCNFAASAIEQACGPSSSAGYRDGGGEGGATKGLQPELFFKMSHEIYNYGEGLIGKVAADHSHKWVYKEPQEQEINFLTSWNNPADSHPRTWEAQFQSGIKTIALIAVREGVVQLGAVNKVMEDLSFIVFLRKKFAYLESIPGVLLPHPSSSTVPVRIDGQLSDNWAAAPIPREALAASAMAPTFDLYDHFSQQMKIAPSMSSLEALLSKLPSVGPAPPGMLQPSLGCYDMPVSMTGTTQRSAMDGGGGGERVTKEEGDEYGAGESSSSMPYSYYASASKSAGEEF
ncbi:protein RICE SALT SENSITIVE 3 [Dendrobium catenatum]|uniref:protein RICE SALT SENSITIVE 3 n=1 Tax=Dendrobium catenatum TaxID=906689 RepID=UPI0009F69E19|nr:protein RICE SALT SENSITIVE 3 [Dendrobium catenatum]XP_020672207.1 protein RICE SALT SENSITIVE 3 [Dendrobium catenatum]XP_028551501.1 protein RICE SALT SENSITIVE 3 [Dendrobium catenatum]XP_028551502.1 protein RICE SALT SENSITIVE 3 [Dendrobium catenatum]